MANTNQKPNQKKTNHHFTIKFTNSWISTQFLVMNFMLNGRRKKPLNNKFRVSSNFKWTFISLIISEKVWTKQWKCWILILKKYLSTLFTAFRILNCSNYKPIFFSIYDIFISIKFVQLWTPCYFYQIVCCWLVVINNLSERKL